MEPWQVILIICGIILFVDLLIFGIVLFAYKSTFYSPKKRKVYPVVAKSERDKELEDTRLQYLSEQYSHISDWASEFDHASTDEKKMILARIIEKIEVDRDYHITITFFVSLDDFTQQITGTMDGLEIREASKIYRTLAS